ncbi:precorrin-8X methylmutase [Streptococcus danieliae]|uniref:Precorrin-8X methylmutase n=1 Tax=Streptococcus danieliae TaxID=747656 RepID=A0A7X3KB16_9STRE|nr:precorrin-8X methylmutase [Streptococcus danieliae]MVX58105.1 precorrin-8X methylmutase [Streptococcus danieliae]
MSYIKNPSSIEKRSFQIIKSEIRDQYPDYQFQSEMEESIIKRCIHTTGDFDYLKTLEFHQDAIESILSVFQEKGTILFDSPISLNGINKRVLDKMGVTYVCLVPQGCGLKSGKTRAQQAIDLAKEIAGPKLFAFGESTEGLTYLLENMNAGELDAAAILALPVGFQDVLEVKEAVRQSSLPSIVNAGYKGGATLVVAVLNAILYQTGQVETEDYVRYSTKQNQE